MKRFDVVTIFPEMFDAVADHGITRRALDEGRFELKAWDPAVLTISAVLLSVVAIGAGLVPAHRASQVDPMIALRHE